MLSSRPIEEFPQQEVRTEALKQKRCWVDVGLPCALFIIVFGAIHARTHRMFLHTIRVKRPVPIRRLSDRIGEDARKLPRLIPMKWTRF